MWSRLKISIQVGHFHGVLVKIRSLAYSIWNEKVRYLVKAFALASLTLPYLKIVRTDYYTE